MPHPNDRPHWRCPWFLAGLAAGLIGGLWLIELGVERAIRERPPFPAISAEP